MDWNWKGNKRMVFSQGMAEVAAIASAPLGLLFFQKVTPEEVRTLKGYIERRIVRPNLDKCESIYHWIAAGMGEGDTSKIDKTLTPDKRAEMIAGNLTKFGISLTSSAAVGFVAKFLCDRLVNVKSPMRDITKSWIVDEAIKIGSIVVMTKWLNKPFGSLAQSIDSLLHKFGLSKEDSRDASRSLVYVGLPEIGGMLGGIAAIWKKSDKGTSL